MTDVLEELTADPLSEEHVRLRLNDWERRVEGLYSQILSWLGPTWSSKRGATRMLEEPMREAGVSETILPTLELLENGKNRAKIEPRGLWIIGANGRLDLTRGQDRWLIVDAADNFDPPRWLVMTMLDRTRRVDLDKAKLLSII